MGDQRNQGPQNPGSGSTDPNKKREDERARQNPQKPYEKDQASNPERREKQDPQSDPNRPQK